MPNPIHGSQPTTDESASFRYLYAKTEMLEEQNARLRERLGRLDDPLRHG